jgi:tRNA pseudouridine55 synthase
MNKSYRAEIALGAATDTEDASGRVTAEKDVPSLDEHTVSGVLSQFLGPLWQIPPMYSAVRSKGHKLYELARRGEHVEREPRLINIYRLQLLELGKDRIVFAVTCSRGTYVRTLCVSIAEKLGTYGHLSSLLRTAVGPFLLAKAYTVRELDTLAANGRLEEVLLPVDTALQHLPAFFLEDEAAARIITGQPVSAADASFDSFVGCRLSESREPAVGVPDSDLRILTSDFQLCRLYHESGHFLAVARYSGNKLHPEKVFWTAD